MSTPTAIASRSTSPPALPRRPRLGFLGVGWIGRHRMQAVLESDLADVAAIADASPGVLDEAAALVPDAERAGSLEALLAHDLDGLVIATPSALHAEQAIAGFERGLAVFCQKPLCRTAAEAAQIVAAARRADRLLAVDFSYRHVQGVDQARELIQTGAIGDVFAVDLTFHNAYGPDKPWFYDPALSGGGCVIDLGSHLVDLSLWMLGWPAVHDVRSQLFREGRPVTHPEREVEDYAVAHWTFDSGAAARLACSWRLSAGRDAVIEAIIYGTRGGVALRNVDGSFYDFTVERFQGTARDVLAAPPDAWGGRAAVVWARQLAQGSGFDDQAERLADVAALLDAVYRR